MRWIIVAVLLMLPVLCCGGVASLIDRYVLLHIHDYEQSRPATIGGVSVNIDVNPQQRINSPPERVVGPPYAMSVMLRQQPKTAVSATLHSFKLRRQDGQVLTGKVTNGHSKWKPELDLTIVYAKFEQGSWGRRPTAIVDLEIELPDRTVREELEIPLRVWHKRDIYVP